MSAPPWYTSEPTVTVKLGGKTLKGGTDYTVSYKDNTNAGTATVTVTDNDGGNYRGDHGQYNDCGGV